MYIYGNGKSEAVDLLTIYCVPVQKQFQGRFLRGARHDITLYLIRVICHLRHQSQVRSTPKRLFSHRGTLIGIFFFFFVLCLCPLEVSILAPL